MASYSGRAVVRRDLSLVVSYLTALGKERRIVEARDILLLVLSERDKLGGAGQ